MGINSRLSEVQLLNVRHFLLENVCLTLSGITSALLVCADNVFYSVR